jgi:hypothetical protein
MGLWLKCPACQAPNPLHLKICTACEASLENLPREKRIYLLLPPGESPEAAAAAEGTPGPAQVPQVAKAPEPPAHHVPAGPVVVQPERPTGAARKKAAKPKKPGKKKQG